MMMDLDGQTAIVTGGAQGIGLGCVRSLVKEGARVAIAD
jgi:NAD(P)-dependent dehydrogenase (short-subunit alcohol dehydrogenase family)